MGRHVPVILSLALLVGCAWRGPAPMQTMGDLSPTANIIAMDKAAWQLVAVQGQQVERLDDGRLQVRLELANLAMGALDVQVQTRFRGDDGMLNGDETPAEIIVIPGGSSKLYEAVSLKANPASFTVEVNTP